VPPLAVASTTPASIGTGDVSLLTITTNEHVDRHHGGRVFDTIRRAGGRRLAGRLEQLRRHRLRHRRGNTLILRCHGPAGAHRDRQRDERRRRVYLNSTGPVTTTNAGTVAAVTATLTVVQHVCGEVLRRPRSARKPSTLTITLTTRTRRPERRRVLNLIRPAS
jgi:hypothetical protein